MHTVVLETNEIEKDKQISETYNEQNPRQYNERDVKSPLVR
jgi:hypothetical protein